MLENGYITRAEYDEAVGSAARAQARHAATSQRREPYFFDYVQEQLIERYGVGVVRRGGLQIHTTIDPEMQDVARDAINSLLRRPRRPQLGDRRRSTRPTARSGRWRPAAPTSDRRFNLAAQGHRQPGSAFKTFVLTAAIRKGVDPDSTSYTSKPLNIDDPTYGHWEVKTFGNTYGGTISLTRATLASDNSVYAQLILDVGPEDGLRDGQAARHHDQARLLPGRGPRRPHARRHAARDGERLRDARQRRRPPPADRHREGRLPRRQERATSRNPEGKRVMTDGQAYEVTQILEMNVQSGTGTAASYGCPAAGKTGTTDEAKDAWFVGYTPHLSTAVWVGYPDAGIAMPGAQGGTYAAPVWHAFMLPAHGDDCDDFPLPTEPFAVLAVLRQVLEHGQPSCRHRLRTAATTTRGPTPSRRTRATAAPTTTRTSTSPSPSRAPDVEVPPAQEELAPPQGGRHGRDPASRPVGAWPSSS